MLARVSLLAVLALLAAGAAHAQAGLKLPDRTQLGIDPGMARGWLAPEYDRLGFAAYRWREGYGFGPSSRMSWSYSMGERASFSMSLNNATARESDLEPRPMSVFGRYWFAQDWALSAESKSSDAGGLLRLQDFRIGVQRRF